MFKLTEKIVSDKLADLIGTKVGWGATEAENRLYSLLHDYANANGLDPLQFCADKASKGWSIDLKYKGYSIGTVEVKREKGKHHSTYWGNGYNDWTYKPFGIWLWNSDKNEDVETRIAAIDRMASDAQRAEDAKKARGREAVELLKKTYGLDGYGVRQFIEYLNSNKYSLTD